VPSSRQPLCISTFARSRTYEQLWTCGRRRDRGFWRHRNGKVDVRDHEAVEALVVWVVYEWGWVDVLAAHPGSGRGLRQGR
jgi:hypothetical protein